MALYVAEQSRGGYDCRFDCISARGFRYVMSISQRGTDRGSVGSSSQYVVMTTLQIQMREMVTLSRPSVKSVQYVSGLTITQHLITEARVSSQMDAILNAYFVITCTLTL